MFEHLQQQNKQRNRSSSGRVNTKREAINNSKVAKS